MGARGKTITLSDALRAANERLKRVRAERGIIDDPALRSFVPAPRPRSPFPVLDNAPDAAEGVVGSGWLTPLVERLTSPAEPETDTQDETATAPIHVEVIRTYASFATAWLREKRTAEARVWLLLREMDTQGRGWLRVEDIREKLTANTSEFRVCGQRRFREILKQGEYLFWHRDTSREGIKRIWIHGAAMMAGALKVERLMGYNVEISLEDVTNGMERFNAALYAVFHASRRGNPISRAVVEGLTGISERRQREYDQIANIDVDRNFAIEEVRTQENAQEHAWAHGNASFKFTDYKGKQGKAGTVYNARRLPNSYQASLQRGTNGRKKKINSKLAATLVKDQEQGQAQRAERRLFYTDARTARKAIKTSRGAILRLSGQKDYGIWTVYNAA